METNSKPKSGGKEAKPNLDLTLVAAATHLAHRDSAPTRWPASSQHSAAKRRAPASPASFRFFSLPMERSRMATARFRITFPHKGTYYYHCALHDIDGMYGVVIVE